MDDLTIFGLLEGATVAVVIGMILHSVSTRFEKRRWALEWDVSGKIHCDAEEAARLVRGEFERLQAEEAKLISDRRAQEAKTRELASLLERLRTFAAVQAPPTGASL